jgi:hypothetical protein
MKILLLISLLLLSFNCMGSIGQEFADCYHFSGDGMSSGKPSKICPKDWFRDIEEARRAAIKDCEVRRNWNWLDGRAICYDPKVPLVKCYKTYMDGKVSEKITVNCRYSWKVNKKLALEVATKKCENKYGGKWNSQCIKSEEWLQKAAEKSRQQEIRSRAASF